MSRRGIWVAVKSLRNAPTPGMLCRKRKSPEHYEVAFAHVTLLVVLRTVRTRSTLPRFAVFWLVLQDPKRHPNLENSPLTLRGPEKTLA